VFLTRVVVEWDAGLGWQHENSKRHVRALVHLLIGNQAPAAITCTQMGPTKNAHNLKQHLETAFFKQCTQRANTKTEYA